MLSRGFGSDRRDEVRRSHQRLRLRDSRTGTPMVSRPEGHACERSVAGVGDPMRLATTSGKGALSRMAAGPSSCIRRWASQVRGAPSLLSLRQEIGLARSTADNGRSGMASPGAWAHPYPAGPAIGPERQAFPVPGSTGVGSGLWALGAERGGLTATPDLGPRGGPAGRALSRSWPRSDGRTGRPRRCGPVGSKGCQDAAARGL